MTTAQDMLAAIDPSRSAAITACAGSGKTWLLVSRMIRLLLAGAAPSSLLAITFTRKAAEEMRARLYEWLEFLAIADDEAVLAFLNQRGLAGTAARSALPRARLLFDAVLDSAPGPVVTTFHGWFLNLLARAPLGHQIPASLIEDAILLKEEAWRAWGESLRRPAMASQAEALTGLLSDYGLTSTRTLLFALLDKRVEWQAWAEGRADPAAEALSDWRTLAGLSETDDVTATLWGDFAFMAGAREYLGLLNLNGQGHNKARERAERLERGLETQVLEDLWPALLNKDRVPYADYREGKAMAERLGGTQAMARFIELHRQLGERIAGALHQIDEQDALRLSRRVLTAGLGLIERYQALKRERDGLDFSDIEWLTLRLLSDPEEADALLVKLDARWKHLMLDEFQDANPLQWRILLAWLSAYGGDPERPSVFLVGDPKQSIYRFRRAEPRLFDVAADWLRQHFGAARYRQNETRRCAPRVTAWVNATFAGLGEEYPDFQPHRAHQSTLPGHCELLAIAAVEPDTPTTAGHLRDPLTEPPPARPDKRAAEAEAVARRIVELVGQLHVARDGGRRARYGDILVLAARRTGLDIFEAAFKSAGIPFVGSRRGGLLDSLEAGDLIALLRTLVTPGDDLSLARALKSPLFGLSDADLQTLATRPTGSWLARLEIWSAHDDAPPQVTRARDLLTAWRAAAGHLPPHDLLDRIYHQGDIEIRYTAAVASHRRPFTRANLRAFLDLSLRLGGGRFPSLPRFLDELAALGADAGDEAPDEPPASVDNAVRMMTIHASKGLEAPVVFLIKTDEIRRDQDHYGVLIDWPPETEQPRHISPHGPGRLRGQTRSPLFEQEERLAARENLNLLYVAMTRAEQALIASGLDTGKDTGWLPRLRAGLVDPALADGPAMSFADTPEHVPTRAPQPMTNPEPVPPVGQRRMPVSAHASFGIRVHRYLELASAGCPAADIEAELGPASDFEDVRRMATTILNHPDCRRFFDAGRGRNELEYLGADGRLRRIDRVVEYDEEVWVLDYKTGDDDPAYREQLLDYRDAIAALYPGKRLRAALLFGDGRVQEVE